MPERRITKVLKLHILKPVGDLTWPELSQLLRDARYRVFRLANLAVSDAYLKFHEQRMAGGDRIPRTRIGQLNKQLRQILEEEAATGKASSTDLMRFSTEGALPANVVDALSQYKLRALLTNAKWGDVLRGRVSLPTYRLDMAIPIRCDKPYQRRLQRTEEGEVEVDLMFCMKPYPRIRIATARNSLSDGHKAVLDRLLDNPTNAANGYRQRCLEVKHDKRAKKWWLFVTYDFPASDTKLAAERIVGVDLGFSCPLYAAINCGHARLGWRHFAALAHRVRSLQNQLMRRRREIQRGGRVDLAAPTARSGHGRNRKLQPIEKLQGKISCAYTTLNQQLSAAVVTFALNNGAGVIQMENLEGLQEVLSGSFLGERWRYEELQRFIEYKAKEAAIELRKVNPRYTSRRCSECGFIHKDFSRTFRDENRNGGKSVRFVCPECAFEADADYNAARNLATLDIERIIADTAARQGL